jgi:glutathione S-transferase
MTHAPLSLYVDSQFASPYAMSAFVALEVSGQPFEMRSVNLNEGDHQQARYAVTSITQRVPTLVHEGFAISESSAIAEYLSELSPGVGLYPKNLEGRARARQVQAWLRSDFAGLTAERSSYIVFYGAKVEQPLSKKAHFLVSKLLAAANILLPDETSNVGGQWSLADVDLAFMLQRLVMNEDDVSAKLRNYASRQWQHPSIQRWTKLPRPPL